MQNFVKEKPPRHKPGEKFIKGPIPWKWIAEAAKLGGSSLKVAIGLWFYAGMKSNRSVKFSNVILPEIGLNRSAKYRGLKKLEDRGLVSLQRASGCSPVVTLLDLQEHRKISNNDMFNDPINQSEEEKCRILKLIKRAAI
jgi:hypothetical protein